MVEVNVWCQNRNMSSLVEDIVLWFTKTHNIKDIGVSVFLKDRYKDIDCWGLCSKTSNTDYHISVCTDQSLRDFVATLMHELVHVQQWVNEDWTGTGEREAQSKQYLLADKFWKSKKRDL